MSSLSFVLFFLIFTAMASPRFDPFTTVRAMACSHELDTGPMASISAFFSAVLTVVYGIAVNIILRTFTRSVTGVSPFISRIKARAIAFMTVRTTLALQIENVCVSLGAVAVMTRSSAVIRLACLRNLFRIHGIVVRHLRGCNRLYCRSRGFPWRRYRSGRQRFVFDCNRRYLFRGFTRIITCFFSAALRRSRIIHGFRFRSAVYRIIYSDRRYRHIRCCPRFRRYVIDFSGAHTDCDQYD